MDENERIYEKSLGFELREDQKSYQVTWCDEGVEEVEIPKEVRGLPVTAIGDCAFADRFDLKSVTIPSTIRSIGISAFWACGIESVAIPSSVTEIVESTFAGCYALEHVDLPNTIVKIGKNAFGEGGEQGSEYCISLESIDLPESLVEIEDRAFFGCKYLRKIHITKNVRSIGDGAFNNCFSVEEITVDKENQNYKSVNCVLFSKDERVLIKYPTSRRDAEYTVPVGVVEISSMAFFKSGFLEKITLPKGLKSIGKHAFCNCSKLKSIEIPEGVSKISEAMLCACEGLEQVILPNSVVEIDKYAFNGCKRLKSINLTKNVSFIGESVFFRCDSLKSIEILNERVTLSNEFNYCQSIESLVVSSIEQLNILDKGLRVACAYGYVVNRGTLSFKEELENALLENYKEYFEIMFNNHKDNHEFILRLTQSKLIPYEKIDYCVEKVKDTEARAILLEYKNKESTPESLARLERIRQGQLRFPEDSEGDGAE